MTISTGSIYDRVTSRILDALEAGTIPWVRPWRSGLPFNAVSRRAYSGVNVLATWLHQVEHRLTSNAFLTFNQARQLGGNVRKGERGCQIVYYARIERPSADVDREEDQEAYFLARGYVVFGVEQCDGLGRLVAELAQEATPSYTPIEKCERVVAETGAVIHERGDRAFYSLATDEITLPPRHTFHSAGGYYSTVFHELGHWTGAPSRLNRQLGGRFGDPRYSFEELVAELTSAFLCARVGLDHVTQAAAYLEGWIHALRSDQRAIFRAAKLATEASGYIWPQTTSVADNLLNHSAA